MMKAVTTLLILVASVTSLWIRDGAIITEEKPVKIVRGTLLVHLELNTSLVIDSLSHLKEFTKKLDVESIGEIFAQRASYIETVTCGEYTRSSRQKRGLFDLGGKALNFLLGTATEEEITDLQKRLRKTIKTQSVKIAHWAHSTQKLTTAVTQIAKELQEEDNKFKNYEANLKFDEFAHAIAQTCTDYNNMIHTASQNEVFTPLFNITLLYKEIEKLEYRWNLRTPVPKNDPRFMETLSSVVENQRTVLIFVPFVDRGLYKRYHFTPFPIFSNMSEKYKFEAIIKNPIVLIDTLNQTVGLMPHDFGTKHRQTNLEFNLCKPFLEQDIKTTKKLCEVNILLNRPNTCEFQHFPENELRVLEVETYRVLSTSRNSTIILKCGQEPPIRKTLKLGIAVTPHNCDLHNSEYRFTAVRKKEIHQSIKTQLLDFPLDSAILHQETSNSRMLYFVICIL